MATSLGNMVIHLGINAQGMQAGAKQAESVVVQLQQKFSGLGSMLAGALGGLSVAGLAGWGVKLAAEAQTAQVAFSVMTGSADTAMSMLGDLRELAASTPLTLTGLQDNAKVMLAFGISAEKILPTLQMLGDISGGDAFKMEKLTLAFSQVAAAGRLMGQDLLQLVNAGFNPLQEISARTGISMVELKKMMEEGKISFAMVEEAFRLATSEGGRFHGMMDQMAQTIPGRFAKLKDNISLAALSVASQLVPAIGKLIDVGIQLTDWIRDLDAGTVQSTIQIVAMAAAFGTAMMIVPKIVAGIMAVVKALRAMSVAQAMQQALSGPGGWATLAVSLGVAAAAGYAVTQMFETQQKELAKTSTEAKKAAAATTEASTAFDSLKESGGDAEAELKKLEQRAASITEAMRTPGEVFQDTMRELNALQEQGLISMETYARAAAKASEELRNAGDAAKELRDVGGVGAAERFTSQGFSAVAEGRREMQKQNELLQRQIEEEKQQTALLTQIRDKPVGPRIAQVSV